MRRNVLCYTCVALILGMLVACSQDEKESRKVTMLIDWFPEPTYLGIYYAQAKGYFSKRGIDLQIENVQGANRAVAAVATNQYPISTASGSATVLSFNQYDSVVSLGVLYPNVASAVYGLKSSGIAAPADLSGRRVGIYPGSINNQEFASFLNAVGVNVKTVEIVAISGSDVALLLEGKIDAAVNYRELSPIMLDTQVQAQGIEDAVWTMNFSDYADLGYGLNVISNRSFVESNSEIADRLFEAIVEGYETGCMNVDDAVAAFANKFPEMNRDYTENSWKTVCSQLGNPVGGQSQKGWHRTISATSEFGLIPLDKVRPDIILPQR